MPARTTFVEREENENANTSERVSGSWARKTLMRTKTLLQNLPEALGKSRDSTGTGSRQSTVRGKSRATVSDVSGPRKSIFQGGPRKTLVALTKIALGRKSTVEDLEDDDDEDDKNEIEIHKPTSVKSCGLELRSKGMVVLPFQVPSDWLKEASEMAGNTLQAAKSNPKGYYDLQLVHKGEIGGKDKPACRERKILDFWEPVIEASSGDGLEGRWMLHASGFLTSVPGSDKKAWPKSPPPATAAEATGAVIIGVHAKGRSLPCCHVMVPLANFLTAQGGLGPATLPLKAGDILIVESDVPHQGFASSKKRPQPMLYWTYLRRGLKLSEQEKMERERKVVNFSTWARQKGLKLPHVALSLIKRQDLRKTAWEEQILPGMSERYEASVDETDGEEYHGQQLNDIEETPRFGFEGFEPLPDDEDPKPPSLAELTMISRSSNDQQKVESHNAAQRGSKAASFDSINSLFKAISTTIAADSPRGKAAKDAQLSRIYPAEPRLQKLP